VIDASLENSVAYGLVEKPKLGETVVAEIVTHDTSDGSDILRHAVGEISRVDGRSVLIIPEEGPWVVVCIGLHKGINPNRVTTTKLFELVPGKDP
jgi:hypothetical protein